MTDLNTLLVFAKVIEAQSFSEAARRLGMPVSSVSRRIAELEDKLGVKLIERSTRNLRLTDVGADLVQHASRAAELNETVESVVANRLAEVSGTLRLSAPPSLAETILVPILHAYQASYPKVRISAFITRRLVDPIADGVDLMLRVGDLKDSSLVARRLARYRHRLVASPGYWSGPKPAAHPRELAGHRLIAFAETPAQQTWHFAHAARKQTFNLSVTPTLAMNDYMGIAHAATGGLGVAELPPMIAAPLLRSGSLVEIIPEWMLPDRDLSLVQPDNRHVPRVVRLFKEIAIRMVPAQIGADNIAQGDDAS